MKRSLTNFLTVALLLIAHAACDYEGIFPQESSPTMAWEVMPDMDLSDVRTWYQTRMMSLPSGVKPAEIMWGTARYRKVDGDRYVISALIAKQANELLKTAYFFKRGKEYSGYVLGHSIDNGTAITNDFTGQLTLYDLDGTSITSSILENGKSILHRNASRLKRLSNLRAATEDDPILLQEIVIESTRIESGTTWLLLSSPIYYDLSHFFPGYQYEGYVDGSYHYAAPVSSPGEVFIFFGGPVININCVSAKFHDNKPATSYSVAIYVDQPKPGTREKWVFEDNGTKLSAGHTFIRLTKNNSDGTKVEYIVGYYPINGDVNALTDDVTDTGGFRNNNMSDFDVSITYNVTALQFYDAIDYLTGFATSTYNLETQNCSDVGIGCAAAMDKILPDTYGSWGPGGGTNPADLGEDIRAMPNSPAYTINRAGGTVSTTHPSGC